MPNNLATKAKLKQMFVNIGKNFLITFCDFSQIIIDVNYLFDPILENVAVNLKCFSKMRFQSLGSHKKLSR